LAHRGLALTADENTLEAFAAALGDGAQIIETDVRATRDGIAVLIHGETLASGSRVQDLSLAELQEVTLPNGGFVPSLRETLAAFPGAKFNIDMKSADAVAPASQAIREGSALTRVLVTSFSGTRQREAVRLLPGVVTSGTATSGTATMVVSAVLAGKLGWTALMRWILRSVDAVQIPERVLTMRTTSPLMVKRFHAAGVEVHVWTINNEADMIRLRAAEVDGIVTDRCDVARRVFAL